MKRNGRTSVLLKAGLVVNGAYLAFMLAQVAADYLFRRGYGFSTEGPGVWMVLLDPGLVLKVLNNLVVIRPLFWPVAEFLFRSDLFYFYIEFPLLAVICAAFFACSLMGVKLLAGGNKRKGALLALTGTAAFFPLGLVGMIGAWQELKKAGKSETATAAHVTGPGSGLPGISSLVRRSWGLYTSRIGTLLGALLLTTALAVPAMLLPAMADYDSRRILIAAFSLDMGNLARNMDHVLPRIPLFLPFLLAVLWGTSAMVRAASSAEFTVGKSFGAAWKKLGQVAGLTALSVFLVAGGYALLAVPGVIVSVWLMFGLYVLMIEDARPLRALATSRELVRGRWWPVLFRFFLLWFVPWIVIVLLNAIVAAAQSAALAVVVLIGLVIFQFFFAPFSIVYLYRLYLDLKETKKEPAAEGDLKRTRSILLGVGGAGWAAGIILAVIAAVSATSLPEAAGKGSALMVRIKLMTGASPEEKNMALQAAVPERHAAIVNMLLEKGADVNWKNAYGATALMRAWHPEIAALLIERGADVNARDSDGNTVLMDAGAGVISVLAERGADVNAKNNEGDTALIRAVKKDENSSYISIDHERVLALLDHGANANIRDKAGNSAFLYALDAVTRGSYIGQDDIAVVEKFIARGADVNVKNRAGLTPLMIVRYAQGAEGADKLEAMLKKAGARR